MYLFSPWIFFFTLEFLRNCSFPLKFFNDNAHDRATLIFTYSFSKVSCLVIFVHKLTIVFAWILHIFANGAKVIRHQLVFYFSLFSLIYVFSLLRWVPRLIFWIFIHLWYKPVSHFDIFIQNCWLTLVFSYVIRLWIYGHCLFSLVFWTSIKTVSYVHSIFLSFIVIIIRVLYPQAFVNFFHVILISFVFIFSFCLKIA